jgi:hypothetical protein
MVNMKVVALATTRKLNFHMLSKEDFDSVLFRN